MLSRHLQLILSLIGTLVGSLEFPLLVLSDWNSLDVVVSPLTASLPTTQRSPWVSWQSAAYRLSLWSSWKGFWITQVWLTYSGICAPWTYCHGKGNHHPRDQPCLFCSYCAAQAPLTFPYRSQGRSSVPPNRKEHVSSCSLRGLIETLLIRFGEVGRGSVSPLSCELDSGAVLFKLPPITDSFSVFQTWSYKPWYAWGFQEICNQVSANLLCKFPYGLAPLWSHGITLMW